MSKFKKLGVIPARYNSSRFPGKPLAKIGEKTLLQYTYEATLKASGLDQVVIATDDDRIYAHAKELGASVFMTNPECQNGTERIIDLLSQEESLNDYELIVNIQGDEPCIEPTVIDHLVKEMEKDNDVQVVTAAAPLKNLEEAKKDSVVKCVFDRMICRKIELNNVI